MKNSKEIEKDIENILDDCVGTDYLCDGEGNEMPFNYIDKYSALPALLFYIEQNFIPK